MHFPEMNTEPARTILSTPRYYIVFGFWLWNCVLGQIWLSHVISLSYNCTQACVTTGDSKGRKSTQNDYNLVLAHILYTNITDFFWK